MKNSTFQRRLLSGLHLIYSTSAHLMFCKVPCVTLWDTAIVKIVENADMKIYSFSDYNMVITYHTLSILFHLESRGNLFQVGTFLNYKLGKFWIFSPEKLTVATSTHRKICTLKFTHQVMYLTIYTPFYLYRKNVFVSSIYL